jgi:hypothetical protein
MRSVPLRLRRCIVSLVHTASSTLVLSMLAATQQKYLVPRINEPLDEGRRIVLKGNIIPWPALSLSCRGSGPPVYGTHAAAPQTQPRARDGAFEAA